VQKLPEFWVTFWLAVVISPAARVGEPSPTARK